MTIVIRVICEICGLNDLKATINRTECDAVVIGRPIDLNRIIKIDKPNTRVYYNLQEIG